MDRELEVMAYNNHPAPAYLNWKTHAEYIVVRYLYAANRLNFISKEDASAERKLVKRKLDEIDKAKEFEIKCWESSAKRTLSACHAMMMYRNNRTLEAADNLVNMLEWLNDECSQDVIPHEYGAKCPNCGRFFNQDHAFRKPVFCEDCGCMLRW